MSLQQPAEQRISDAGLVLKSAGLVAASGPIGNTIDLGAAEVRGDFITDVSVIEQDSLDEFYLLLLWGSNDAAHASGQHFMAAMAPDATGRFIIPFSNVWNDVVYRYVKLYCFFSGTIATGINFKSRLAPMRQAGVP